MNRTISALSLAIVVAISISGCGSGSGGGGNTPPPPALVSYVGTTGVFAAWGNASSGGNAFAPMGSYAAKKQSLHGSIDFTTGTNLSQPAGIEVYKGSDGHIYELDLTSTSTPVAQQLSTETAATVDDTCSFTGTTADTGAFYSYAGIFFASDLQNPVNSSYVYRLPGPDGVCNTADDVFHMVKTGMSASSAPIVATGMPVAAVHNSTGGITGFVIISGANLVLVDSNFANPATLGTFGAPINVAVALPVGTTQGYPTDNSTWWMATLFTSTTPRSPPHSRSSLFPTGLQRMRRLLSRRRRLRCTLRPTCPQSIKRPRRPIFIRCLRTAPLRQR